ncbi:c-type cytochrome [Woeseia oceani]|nr:cytochrome c [Woeseia oceani]
MNRNAWIAIAIFSVPCLMAGGVYLASEWRLRNVELPDPFVATIPTDAASIEHGRHVARIRGCFGCHGQSLEGRVYTDQWPWVELAVAPNLAAYAQEHSPATLEAAIRHGIGVDGRALWSMPSYNWTNLSDSDLVALIAFLRSAEVQPSSHPKPKLGWSARWEIASGSVMHMADWVSLVPPLQYQDHPLPAMRLGEYLAMTMCNECHGLDLRGAVAPDGRAPDLAILAAYSEADFRTLLATGTAIGGRDNLNLMSMVARDRFPDLTDEEISSLYFFLNTLGVQPVAEDVPWRPKNE